MHRYVREIDQALRPVDLTHLQFTILTLVAWMSRTADIATQAELARFGEIHPMQVSNVLKTLEAKRLVDRRRASTNVVAKQVTITSLGLGKVREALPLAIGVQQRLFGQEGGPGGHLLRLLRSVADVSAPRAPSTSGNDVGA